MEINDLIIKLHEAKAEEAKWKAYRTELEEELADAIRVPDDWEGSKTRKMGEFKVQCRRVMNRRIDGDMLRDIAMEHMLGMVVEQCFRWKPELVKSEWDAETEEHRKIFAPAIITTPGKVSFKIERIEA